MSLLNALSDPQFREEGGKNRVADVNQQISVIPFDGHRALFSTRVNPFEINWLQHFFQSFRTEVFGEGDSELRVIPSAIWPITASPNDV